MAEDNQLAETPTTVAEEPKRMVGLQAGRIVNYVMLDKTMRPFMVIRVNEDSGRITGALFYDGAEDFRNHPIELSPAERSGHIPAFSRLLRDVEFDADHFPGTWHWPDKQAVMATGLDADSFRVMFEAHADEIVTVVDKKLEATVETVNRLLDEHGVHPTPADGAEPTPTEHSVPQAVTTEPTTGS